MTTPLTLNGASASPHLLAFAQDLVRTRSYSGQEEAAARLIAAKMEALGYDEVAIDRWGNVLGRVGHGPRTILFDSHTDTVAVHDAGEWAVPPFGGEILDGWLWGRGSVDMKSGLAASVYAAALAKNQGLLGGKSVYVTGTVFEEDCDGEGLKRLLADRRLRPDYAVICEPSSNRIATGHKGKAQVIIRTRGVSAHGASPEKGVNAVYAMAGIIPRVDRLNASLMAQGGRHGTVVLSRISSTSVSLNAVPSECEIYLDRRTVVGETEEAIRSEMDALIAGADGASWELGTLHRTAWTGAPITYEPLHPAWEIGLEHPLAQALTAACRDALGRPPQEPVYWDYSTNAVAVVSQGIPTIGFGPGDGKLAHMRDERCPVQEIIEACGVYMQLIGKL